MTVAALKGDARDPPHLLGGGDANGAGLITPETPEVPVTEETPLGGRVALIPGAQPSVGWKRGWSLSEPQEMLVQGHKPGRQAQTPLSIRTDWDLLEEKPPAEGLAWRGVHPAEVGGGGARGGRV